MQALVYREGGSAVMEGGVPINIVEIVSTNAAAWDATLDVNSNNVRIVVTGANSETINWSTILEVTHVI
jgi:hypothetical protein